MSSVLGIDAAWTERQPSGVALVQREKARWKCIATAPSYETFLSLARGEALDWSTPSIPGGSADVDELLSAAEELCGERPDVVAVDMPLATVKIDGRRAADNAISHAFGGRGCGAHSPSAKRPGVVGQQMQRRLEANRFKLATRLSHQVRPRSIIEVYPHVALLALLQACYRLEYKTSKTTTYWPKAGLQDRIQRLLEVLKRILARLNTQFDRIEFSLPKPEVTRTLKGLKRYEDCLDALVCAWMGVLFVEKSAYPYGDETAAIWVPKSLGSEADHMTI